MLIRQEKSNNTGFTLIEALVSLVLLSLAIVPALYLSTTAVSSALLIEHNLIAANLAQEGVEVIRAMRDANWFNNSVFDSGLSAGIYRVEWNSDSLIPLGSNPFLKINNGLYNYTSGTDTIFKRTVDITKISSSELRVVSTITWTEKGNRNKNIPVESHLFNWKQ